MKFELLQRTNAAGVRALYDIRMQPHVLEWTSGAGTWEQHLEYVKNFDSGKLLAFLLSDDSGYLAYQRFMFGRDRGWCSSTGAAVRGRGYGSAALSMGLTFLRLLDPSARVWAHIHDQNEASIYMSLKCGLCPTAEVEPLGRIWRAKS